MNASPEHPLSSPALPRPGLGAWCAGLCLAAMLGLAAQQASGQQPFHFQDRADLPPGTVGLRQLERGGPRPGYFQPVLVSAPKGSTISVAQENDFDPRGKNQFLAGMLIGHVYRLKVTGVKFHEDAEIFPTIELLDRLYPPPGQAVRFPVPVELTEEELQMAVAGQFVTRVIYVENPRTALPVQDHPPTQRYFEAAPGEDPLQAADRLGRPIAILRMGSRVPTTADDERFNYRNPPLIPIEAPVQVQRRDGLEEPLEGPDRQGLRTNLFPRR